MPNIVICHYSVKAGSEEAFEDLLRRHLPALAAEGLISDRPAQYFRGQDRQGRPLFFEIFEWIDDQAPRKAHESAAIGQGVWQEMSALCEERDGQPAMDFPHVDELQLGS